MLSLEVGWVLGESLRLAVGLTTITSLGTIFLGGACVCTPSSLDVDLVGEITDHVGRAAVACLRPVPS